MEGEANGNSQRSATTEETAEDSEKPPPWALDDPVLTNEIREFLENEDDTLISREDIENSLKKYEELSRQLSETKKSLEQYGAEGYTEEPTPTTPRRTSLEDERSNDGEVEVEGEKHALEKTFEALSENFERPSSGHDGSEEERSRSDDELMRDTPQVEEERSKSDGDKDEEDDDAIPLRIQAAQKSNKLSLSNCWLKTIPSEVWDLTHLTELDLSANYLKKVSKSIGNLMLLKRLRLNHNQLTILPKEIWSLTKLTTLLLNNNNIKVIPKEIKNLTKLKALDLSSNQINEIPVKEGIIHLPSLIELRLRNNQLTTLPAAMGEMTQLQVLWLEGNPMPVPKSVLKRNAGAILAYMKEHPNFAKRPSIDAGNPRLLRKPPPTAPAVNSHGHIPGKKDLGILAEKELKKRKREQLEEMRKHLEVEKKVKHLEHELMRANAKAMKFEEEAKKVEQPLPHELMSPPEGHAQQPLQVQIPAHSPQGQAMSPVPPSPFPGVQFGQIPPHVVRQQGPPQIQHNEYKPYPPVPPPVQQQQQQQQQLQQQQQQQQQANPLGSSQTNISAPPSPSKFEWEIPLMELSFGPRIGRGGYGEVYRGMWGGTEVAVKMLFTDNMNAKLLDDLRKEVDLLCKLRHPNIVLFMGACTEPGSPCIVTEYLGRGSLASIIMDHSVDVDWGMVLQIGIDTARGMAYLHSRNPVIIHRDLKTDNLLVDDNWQVKLADFGLATVKSRTFAKTMCGTTGWVAPEVLAEQGYTEKADVYSFAIILWELLTRQIPYAGKNTMQVVRSIDRGERLIIPPTCPPDYSTLINVCWDTDPSVRPSFAKILATLERMRGEYQAQKSAAAAAPVPKPSADHNGNNDAQATNNDVIAPPNGTALTPNGTNAMELSASGGVVPMETAPSLVTNNDVSSEPRPMSITPPTAPTPPPPSSPSAPPPLLPDGAPGTHTRFIIDNSLT